MMSKRERHLMMYRQKFYGLLLIAAGLILPKLDGDITASVLFVPAGIGLIVTRQCYL